jgi:glucose-1-phosphate thymidylyltransferase
VRAAEWLRSPGVIAFAVAVQTGLARPSLCCRAMALKGVILAGGSGSRLFPLSLVTNKHLLPVYDRPMIFYPLETLREMGCREVLVVVGGRSVGDIMELLHDGSEFGLSLTYRYQRDALGIAHALGLARDFAGSDPVSIVLGDNILHGSLDGFAERFVEGTAEAGAVLKEVPDPERFGVAEFDTDGRLRGFEEKPERPKSNLIPIGVYLFRPSVFEVIATLQPSKRGEFEITDVLNRYLQRGELIWQVFDGEWQDAGTVESLVRANNFAERFAAQLPSLAARPGDESQAERTGPPEVRR